MDKLASEGWDVWCVCLRGNGSSYKPGYRCTDPTEWWNIDDHLCQDVPAVLAYVLDTSGAKQVHWMGHSMGGMLVCGLLCQRTKFAATICSASLVASGCFGNGSWHATLKPLVKPLTRLGFPADMATKGLALLADMPVSLAVFEALFYWPPNMEPVVRKHILASCFHFIPETLVGQFLASHDGPQGLKNVRGNFMYADPAVLGSLKIPVLAVNGDWDLFCPPAGGLKTLTLFGSAHKKFICFGPAAGSAKAQFGPYMHDCTSHYGHFDVIQGRAAQAEVWPHLMSFLSQHDE